MTPHASQTNPLTWPKTLGLWVCIIGASNIRQSATLTGDLYQSSDHWDNYCKRSFQGNTKWSPCSLGKIYHFSNSRDWGPVDTNAFSFEYAYISLRLGLASTLTHWAFSSKTHRSKRIGIHIVWVWMVASEWKRWPKKLRHFHVVVVQWHDRNVQKSVMLVQNCCLVIKPIAFLTFLLPSRRRILRSLL